MGTNYYAVEKRVSLHRRVFHIGKASAGWKFCFRGYQGRTDFDSLCIKSIEDWKSILSSGDFAILNEYNDEVTYDDFFKMVEDMQSNHNKENFTLDANVGGYRFFFDDFG